MKRYILIICTFFAVLATQAEIKYTMPGFSWIAGAKFNSVYLSRGRNVGGINVQPQATIGYAGLKFLAWGNIGATDNSCQELLKEIDLKLSYSVFGFSVGFMQLFYFDGTPFFNFTEPTLEQFETNTRNTAQTEFSWGYDFNELTHIPLHIEWITRIAGSDHYIAESAQGKYVQRAYSTYIGVGYDWSLPLGFTLSPKIGITPWKSAYTYFKGDFAVNELSLKLNWRYKKPINTNANMLVDVYLMGVMNTHNLNAQTAVILDHTRHSEQRLNCLVGMAIWFE